jgi:hypothetical protein
MGEDEGELEEEIFEDFQGVVGSGEVGVGKELVGEGFGLRLEGILEVLFLQGFVLERATDGFGEERAFFNEVIARFLVKAIDEAVDEVIVGADAGGIVFREATKQSKQGVFTSLIDPVGDAGDVALSHEQEGAKEGFGVPIRAAGVRGISGKEDRFDEVEIETGDEEKIFAMVLQKFEFVGIVQITGEGTLEMIKKRNNH